MFKCCTLSSPQMNNGLFHFDCEERKLKKKKKHAAIQREKESNYGKKGKNEGNQYFSTSDVYHLVQ